MRSRPSRFVVLSDTTRNMATQAVQGCLHVQASNSAVDDASSLSSVTAACKCLMFQALGSRLLQQRQHALALKNLQSSLEALETEFTENPLTTCCKYDVSVQIVECLSRCKKEGNSTTSRVEWAEIQQQAWNTFSLRPKDGRCWMALVDLFEQYGLGSSTLGMLEQVRSVAPLSVDVAVRLAIAYARQGQFGSAHDLCSAALLSINLEKAHDLCKELSTVGSIVAAGSQNLNLAKVFASTSTRLSPHMSHSWLAASCASVLDSDVPGGFEAAIKATLADPCSLQAKFSAIRMAILHSKRLPTPQRAGILEQVRPLVEQLSSAKQMNYVHQVSGLLEASKVAAFDWTLNAEWACAAFAAKLDNIPEPSRSVAAAIPLAMRILAAQPSSAAKQEASSLKNYSGQVLGTPFLGQQSAEVAEPENVSIACILAHLLMQNHLVQRADEFLSLMAGGCTVALPPCINVNRAVASVMQGEHERSVGLCRQAAEGMTGKWHTSAVGRSFANVLAVAYRLGRNVEDSLKTLDELMDSGVPLSRAAYTNKASVLACMQQYSEAVLLLKELGTPDAKHNIQVLQSL